MTKERTWARQDELFILQSNGAEELSGPGRKTFDAMMANFLRFTKDRAVIVEGYAAAGTLDELDVDFVVLYGRNLSEGRGAAHRVHRAPLLVNPALRTNPRPCSFGLYPER